MDAEGNGSGNGLRHVTVRMPFEYRVITLQAVLVVIVALGAFALGGAPTSAVAGGVCILAPNAWMAKRARGKARPGQEMESAAGLFLAMLVKLGFTIALMAIVLSRAEAIDGPAFFAGLIAALIGHHASFLLVGDATEEAPEGVSPDGRQVDRE